MEYVPCQGTLIALLRYGTFPSGRLSDAKLDVVDNDSEIIILQDPAVDVKTTSRHISRMLEADGWPPCEMQTAYKLVCFSLQLEVPMKLELYFYQKDVQKGILTGPLLGGWGEGMPLEIIYPFSSCRLGSSSAFDGWARKWKLNFRTEDGEVGGESAIDHKLQGVQGMKWK